MSDDYVVATSDIPFGAVYAYRRGDKVRKDAVDANGWGDLVSPVDSKEAREAQGIFEESEETPAEPSEPAAPPQPPQARRGATTTTAVGGEDK